MNRDDLPLSGVRVIEFSHMVAGPFAGLVLADLGADVIKVEPAPNGDNTRRLTGSGVGFFPCFNRNKRSALLDLKTPDGLATAKRLVGGADVVIENFRPGAMDRLGLGREQLKAVNPRLIYCSVKGFLAGPYEDRAALDEVVQMMAGLAYMTGPPGRPLRVGSSVNDIMGGMFAAIGVLGALRKRDRGGPAEDITSGLFETCMVLMAQHMMQDRMLGQRVQPMPMRLSAWGVYDVFDCSDGQLFIGVVTDTQWRVFCEGFGLADLAADARLQTNAQRCDARDWLIPRLGEVFKTMRRADLEAKVAGLGLPYAPVARPEDLFDDPHLKGSGGFLDVSLPDGSTAVTPALPMTFNDTRLGVRRDVPAPGADTRDVLAEAGLSAAEIAGLIGRGIAV